MQMQSEWTKITFFVLLFSGNACLTVIHQTGVQRPCYFEVYGMSPGMGRMVIDFLIGGLIVGNVGSPFEDPLGKRFIFL